MTAPIRSAHSDEPAATEVVDSGPEDEEEIGTEAARVGIKNRSDPEPAETIAAPGSSLSTKRRPHPGPAPGFLPSRSGSRPRRWRPGVWVESCCQIDRSREVDSLGTISARDTLEKTSRFLEGWLAAVTDTTERSKGIALRGDGTRGVPVQSPLEPLPQPHSVSLPHPTAAGGEGVRNLLVVLESELGLGPPPPPPMQSPWAFNRRR